MIRNELPFTNENGWQDDQLMTDCSKEVQRDVQDWINAHIQPAKKYANVCSYGLKYLQEKDTGHYLTNNQFKHAMQIAGYTPKDPNELNWRYRIKVIGRHKNCC